MIMMLTVTRMMMMMSMMMMMVIKMNHNGDSMGDTYKKNDDTLKKTQK